MPKYTLTDPIVRIGLSAIADISTDGLLLAGGMANQFYVNGRYPELLRPTHDSDFSRVPPMDSASFNAIYNEVAQSLLRYKPSRGRDREGFFIQMSKDEIPFFMHFEKPTKSYWERIEGTRKRQYNTANVLTVPDTTSKLRVVRPEEIIAVKLRRLRYLEKSGLLSGELSGLYEGVKQREFDRLTDVVFSNWLRRLGQLKDSLSGHFEAGVEHGMRARQIYNGEKDLYDISLLAKLLDEGGIEFDESYYGEIV